MKVNCVTRTVVLALLATGQLAGAQGTRVAKEFQRPSQGFAIVHKGHGPPITYASCEVTYAWTRRQLDGTVIMSGEEHGELGDGRTYQLAVDLTGRQLGETRRDWTGTEIVDITVRQARCPSLPNGLRIEPGAVIRQDLRGALDIVAPPEASGGWPVVRSVKVSGSAVVVNYYMSRSLMEWTQQYPMTQIEARLAHAQAQLDIKAGRSAEAIRGLQRALALEPALPTAALDLAELLLTADKPDDAFAAIAEVARTRPVWLYHQILERPVLARLRDVPALQAQVTSKGDARWDGGALTVAYSPATDTFAVNQGTDFDGNGGGSWVDFIGADGRSQTSIEMVRCLGGDCSVLPHSTELVNRMLADLGFSHGETGQDTATSSSQGCRFRFPSVHIGVVCGKDQVRVVTRDTVLVEQALQGYRYRFAIRFGCGSFMSPVDESGSDHLHKLEAWAASRRWQRVRDLTVGVA